MSSSLSLRSSVFTSTALQKFQGLLVSQGCWQRGQGQTGRYEGTASGQFYGPAAAEVGGVFQGTHTGESSVLQGWFGGTKQ